MLSNAPQRQRRILEMLEKRDTVRNADIRKQFGVTEMTVWRDLVALEERGLVRRARGRVMRANDRLVEPDFHSKTDRSGEAKDRIAAYVVEQFLQAGDTLAMDGGTTVAAIARQNIPSGLTILTNSLYTAERFLRHPARPVVHVCGGLLREQSGTFIGREAIAFFRRRQAGRYFLSATGVDANAGITDLTLEDNEVKQAMARISKEVILLADQSKIGIISLMQVFPWCRIQHLVTDAPLEVTRPIQVCNRQTKVHTV